MDTSAAQTAINLALSGNWQEAVKVNLEILAENPEDTDALNRLAKAYVELGKTELANETAKKVLKIDATNPIAVKCLEKWKSAGKNNIKPGKLIPPESFLEESGKTKLVSLVNLGEDKVIASLDSGDEVKILASAHRLSIISSDGKHIGRLPDDLAARLGNLIKAGNHYQVLIKSIEPKEVTVFIRETERGAKAPDIPSFPPEKIDYVSFTPPEFVHKDIPEMGNTEESSEDQ